MKTNGYPLSEGALFTIFGFNDVLVNQRPMPGQYHRYVSTVHVVKLNNKIWNKRDSMSSGFKMCSDTQSVSGLCFMLLFGTSFSTYQEAANIYKQFRKASILNTKLQPRSA